jgi:hypothetical protein
MKELDNTDAYSTRLKPKGGLQASLSSNNVLSCSSPLGFTNSFSSDDEAIDYLADILVEAFLDQKKYETNNLIKS